MNTSEIQAEGRVFRAAIASQEGILVNQHLGQADRLLIFEFSRDSGCRLIERRATPLPGSPERWQVLAGRIQDCDALLVNSLGASPLEALTACGVQVYQINGLIEDALHDLWRGVPPRMPAHTIRCRRSESGESGMGCA